jgi:hypothetical protein
MDASRSKAIEFLKGKGITSPETIVAKLDDIGLDKIDSLVKVFSPECKRDKSQSDLSLHSRLSYPRIQTGE